MRPIAFLLVVLSLVACGCGRHAALQSDTPILLEPWEFDGREARIVRTEHYRIHTTIEDPAVLSMLAQVMEGALAQYRQFAPGVRLSPREMECYIFQQRAEWAQFTRDNTGADALIYLKINRGGYTVRDWYVAYFIGDIGTYGVAAHEGWHQYVARHFKSRLPPFLEEGIATMFETITWSNGRPRWSLAVNPTRAQRLRRAIDQDGLWPLETLITMHAGDVVHLSGTRIETFYAQNWAFAQFLWDAENQRYRPALQRMLSDLAAGTAPPGVAARSGASPLWNPAAARPLLEHYLGMPLDQIERAYLAYVKRIAGEHHYEFSNAS